MSASGKLPAHATASINLTTGPNSNDTPLVRKMGSIFALSDKERQALRSLPMQIVSLKADQDLVREGDRPSRSCLFLEGFGCAYKITGDGKRQIMAFKIPGDIPDLHSLHLEVLDTSVATISPCKVGLIPHEALHDLCNRYPRIAVAFWRDTLVDGATCKAWLLNVGQREAYSRMAHVLCELLVRLKAVGLVDGHSCNLPITQAEFSDALGISTVHVSRVLRQLRADKLVVMRGARLTVLNWERLKEVGDFDPTYLHLHPGEAG